MNNTKKNKEIIPIFFAVDDKYSAYLTVAMRSLIDNSSKKYDYHINILIDTLSKQNKEMLLSLREDNIKIEFVNVADKLKSLCEKLHLRDYYTKATYYRFFIPEMFPEFKRGVYLDCDIVLTRDVAQLYHAILGNNLVAAITDEIITDIECFAEYSEVVLNIPRNKYFNAGILVMNLEEMRKIHIEQKFAKLLGEKTYRVAQDQDYLNVLCYNKVTYMNKRWNKTPMPYSDPDDIPYIAHYKINYKPWKYDNVVYGDLFWEYAKKTPVYDALLEAKGKVTSKDIMIDQEQYENLIQMALDEVEAYRAESLEENTEDCNFVFAEA